MVKRNNIISTLISFIFWIFFKDRTINTIENCGFFKERKVNVIKLNDFNFDELDFGRWQIIQDKESIQNQLKNEKNVTNNIAFLDVEDFSTASAAAKLGVKNVNEVIYLENGYIVSDYGSRKVDKNVSEIEILDYWLFYKIHNLKKCFMEKKQSFKRHSFNFWVDVIKFLMKEIIMTYSHLKL